VCEVGVEGVVGAKWKLAMSCGVDSLFGGYSLWHMLCAVGVGVVYTVYAANLQFLLYTCGCALRPHVRVSIPGSHCSDTHSK